MVVVLLLLLVVVVVVWGGGGGGGVGGGRRGNNMNSLNQHRPTPKPLHKPAREVLRTSPQALPHLICMNRYSLI